ncbi:hypothetical protein A4R44_04199 [Amycolatopsis sp. M39]|nr:hypothetical protein A4R44_04199 [Amycolatopsis sp. M39]
MRSDGLGYTCAPKVSIISLRYGFWSYDARTCQTSQDNPNVARANAGALPHCPAPVSVVSRVTPSAALQNACGAAVFSLCEPTGLTPSYW